MNTVGAQHCCALINFNHFVRGERLRHATRTRWLRHDYLCNQDIR
ncbi:MAG: hypothetical protein V7K54_23220 [Nostoc sp.]